MTLHIYLCFLFKFNSRWKQAVWSGEQQIQVGEELLDEWLVSIITTINQIRIWGVGFTGPNLPK